MSSFRDVDDFAIRAENISKKFLLGRRSSSLKERLTGTSDRNKEEFWAFEDVSVTVPRGSMLGIIGRNGSGKSTLLRALCGVYRPTTGQILVRGRITALLELGAGFHGELTGRENIYMNGAVVGLSRDYMDEVMDDIVDMADIGSFIDAPIETYSSGMRARLGFAVSVQMQPEILLADEITAVGDIAFKEHGVRRMNELRENGATIVQVSHSLPMLQQNCDQILWLHHGRTRRLGDPADVIAEYTEHCNIDRSGRRIGGGPVPKQAAKKQAAKKQAAKKQAVAQRKAAAAKVAAEREEVAERLTLGDLHAGWFDELKLTGVETPDLTTGKPAKLTLRISPDQELVQPSVEVRVLTVKGRETGLGFDSGPIEAVGLDSPIEATMEALKLSAGLYNLRVDLLSAGNVVASAHHSLKVRWPPEDEVPFSPMLADWTRADEHA